VRIISKWREQFVARTIGVFQKEKKGGTMEKVEGSIGCVLLACKIEQDLFLPML
jgi:hypothetical protein